MLDLMQAVAVATILGMILTFLMIKFVTPSNEELEARDARIEETYRHAVSMGPTWCLNQKADFSENTPMERRQPIERAIHHFIELESKND